jgi:hypothetical protein
VLLAALWTYYVLNRLWQQSLAEEAAGALAEASALGLDVRPPALGACLVAVGQIEGQDLRLEWRGGLYGERSVLRLGQSTRDLPLLRDAAALRAALGLPPTPAA